MKQKEVVQDRSFKQRKYYWKQKGFTEEQAISKAKGKSKLGSVKKSNNNIFKKSYQFENIFHIYVPVFVTALFTVLLVNSATDFFGKSPEGILKAIALECGILALVAYKATSFSQNVFRLLCLTAAITLSISVLHVGAKTSSVERQSVLTSIDENISSIKERRSEFLTAVNALPESHTTNKRRMLSEVTAADKTILELSNKKEALLMSSSPLTASLSEMTDTFVRIVFLMLNMFFTHLLAAKLRSKTVVVNGEMASVGLIGETWLRVKRIGISAVRSIYVILGGIYVYGEDKLPESRAVKT